jgi:5-methylcytosine-specific restriction endonuclease McrA
MSSVISNGPGFRPIEFAERVLALLDEGKFTATYKYAVLLALIDLCVEKTSRAGDAPNLLTTRELAEKVVENYWTHITPFHDGSEGRVLRQNKGAQGTQAEILTFIHQFRQRACVAHLSSRFAARKRDPGGYERLVDQVEWKLIEMPLPRLQRVGALQRQFIYSWAQGCPYAEVRAYQTGKRSGFDNRLLLKPGVGEALCRLSGLLRPLIQQQWAQKVAQINAFEEARLKDFLFGASRIDLTPLRSPLADLQSGRCFYCNRPFCDSPRRRPEVDHFIPWSRSADNSLTNLVAAHSECNLAKRDFFASGEHLTHWAERDENRATEIRNIASDLEWEVGRERSIGISRALYLRLPAEAPLWHRGREFVPADPELIRRCLCRTAG